jgi:hypothetical protein
MSTVSVGTTQATTLSTSTQATQTHSHHGHGGGNEAQLNQINAQIKKLGGSPVSPGKDALKQAREILQQLQQQQQSQQAQKSPGIGVGTQGKQSTGIPNPAPTLLGSSSPISTLTGTVSGGASGVALPSTAVPPVGAAAQLDLSA